VVWIADYQYRPDWMREAYFCRALLHHMTFTHPVLTIHQGWPSVDCEDLAALDYLCASTLGSAAQCGGTGRIDLASVEQLQLLREWIEWSKANRKYLAAYQHLFEDDPPVPLETATDDEMAGHLARTWLPSGVDGFAHLLSDGGWVFLFNPTDRERSVGLELDLSAYGIHSFAGIEGCDDYEHRAEENLLRITHRLAPGSYARMRVHAEAAGC
jgi:hypothetical protein